MSRNNESSNGLKLLDEYTNVISPNGTKITVIKDNGLFLDNENPWHYFSGKRMSYRYKRDPKNNNRFYIEKFKRSGDWESFGDDSDDEYWQNYLQELDKKLKTMESQNIFQHMFNPAPFEKQGGSINYLDLF